VVGSVLERCEGPSTVALCLPSTRRDWWNGFWVGDVVLFVVRELADFLDGLVELMGTDLQGFVIVD